MALLHGAEAHNRLPPVTNWGLEAAVDVSRISGLRRIVWNSVQVDRVWCAERGRRVTHGQAQVRSVSGGPPHPAGERLVVIAIVRYLIVCGEVRKVREVVETARGPSKRDIFVVGAEVSPVD